MSPLELPLPGLPAPVVDESRPFWDGLAAGEIRAPRCSDCGRSHFPVLPSCPYCGERDLVWTAVGESARVFSWIVVRRGMAPEVPVPYTVVLAEFPTGVKIPGNLIGEAELAIELPLRARIVAADGTHVVAFESTADG